MQMPIRFSDLLDAFKFVIARDFDQNHAFIQRDRRDICKSEASGADELLDDVGDGTKYSAIPTTRPSISAGPWSWTLQANVASDFDEVRHMFTKKGAYAKFKALPARGGALARRYSFEERATERALRK
jgi:hypothetical protein